MDIRMGVKITKEINGPLEIKIFYKDSLGISGDDVVLIDNIAAQLGAKVVDPKDMLNDYLNADFKYESTIAQKENQEHRLDYSYKQKTVPKPQYYPKS
ncbi:MAG: hypothetical protein K0B02_05500 [DPANN group archaeon]|nr:hypothetical protein [DPANN group archaeon]